MVISMPRSKSPSNGKRKKKKDSPKKVVDSKQHSSAYPLLSREFPTLTRNRQAPNSYLFPLKEVIGNKKLVAVSALESLGITSKEVANDEEKFITSILEGVERQACFSTACSDAILGSFLDSRSGETLEMTLSGMNEHGRRGYTTLREVLREFLAAQYHKGLGLPTAEIFAVISMDASPQAIKGTIGKSFLSIDEFLSLPNSVNEVRKLANHALSADEVSPMTMQDYSKFFCRVVQRNASLIAKWQAVGFVHGSTPTLSLEGAWIPSFAGFTFMDVYYEDYVSDSSDTLQKYRFSQQPTICREKCASFGSRLAPLFVPSYADMSTEDIEEMVESILKEAWDHTYESTYWETMKSKFGFFRFSHEDKVLIRDFLNLVEKTGGDYLNIMKKLEELKVPMMWPFDWKQAADQPLTDENNANLDLELRLRSTNFEDVLGYIISQTRTIEDEKIATEIALLPSEQGSELIHVVQMPEPACFMLPLMGHSNASINNSLKEQLKHIQLDCVDADFHERERITAWRAWLQRYSDRLMAEIDYDKLFGRPKPEKVEKEGHLSEEKRSISPTSKKSKKSKSKEEQKERHEQKKSKKEKKKKWKKLPFDMASEALEAFRSKRQEMMKATNPRIGCRNYVLDEAISEAEVGQFHKVRALSTIFADPFGTMDYDSALNDVLSEDGLRKDALARRVGGKELAARLAQKVEEKKKSILLAERELMERIKLSKAYQKDVDAKLAELNRSRRSKASDIEIQKAECALRVAKYSNVVSGQYFPYVDMKSPAGSWRANFRKGMTNNLL